MSRFLFFATISNSVVSIIILTLLNFIFGEDRAGALATVLQLGNGIIVAALLGGIIGLWLALGSVKHAAWLAGTMIGIIVAPIVWSAGGRYTWVIDSLLVGLFGKVGATFTPLVATMILFGAMRWATQTSALYIEAAMRHMRLVAQRNEATQQPSIN